MLNKKVHLISNRQFNWISSVTGDSAILSALNEKMAWFYGQKDGRKLYQQMLETQEVDLPPEDSVRHLMPKYLYDLQPENVLEIGCGDGRLYRQIRSYGYTGRYSGIEVADYIINQNQQRHPEVNWKCCTAYEIPFPDNYFDVCFSLYVLEHLVYPEQALKEMLRVLKIGGRLILVFPDFAKSGRFASQQLGFSSGTFSEKLQSFHVVDALVSLYDSRFRLPITLRKAVVKFGAFPVNTRPICLSYSNIMGVDIDAVYIASKQEIHNWAIANNYRVDYPCGIQGEFAEQAFMIISK